MIGNWTATLSVNAGLSLRNGELCIWADAVHDEKVPDYSTLTKERQRLLFESEMFRDPDLIFFTHCHADHFSARLCKEAMRRYPDARVAAPEPVCKGQIILGGQETVLIMKNCLLTFRKLIHEGEQYADVPHYGMLVEDEGERILVLGDCAICGEDLREWIRKEQVDTVFAPFPWITLERGSLFLTEEINPSTLVIYHLPLKEDDPFGYIKAAERSAEKLRKKCNVLLLTEAFQTVEL